MDLDLVSLGKESHPSSASGGTTTLTVRFGAAQNQNHSESLVSDGPSPVGLIPVLRDPTLAELRRRKRSSVWTDALMLIRCGSSVGRCPLAPSLWGYRRAGRRQRSLLNGHSVSAPALHLSALSIASSKAGPRVDPGAFNRKHLIGRSGTCGTQDFCRSKNKRCYELFKRLKRLFFLKQFGSRKRQT